VGGSTLRRELIAAFAIVFAGAMMVAVAGVLLLLPTLETPLRAFFYVALLVVIDIAIFALFGRWLIQRRVLDPLERMVGEAEAIADGDYGRRLPDADTAEVARLSDSLNRMAGRLIEHQWQLRRNIESLEETNQELTAARDDLIRAEKMASLGQMAAGVAHEIGNPLAAIMGNVDLLKRRLQGRELEMVKATAEQTTRIDRIVRGLLDYARAREAKVRPIDVNEVVRTSVDLVTGQRRFVGIEVDLELPDGVPAVVADPYQLEQVFVNLFLNAADAMEASEGKVIRIGTSTRVYSAPVHVPARRKDDPPGIDYSHRRRFNRAERVPRLQPFESGTRIVEVSVEDTGPGIPPDVVDQVFEPFMTTKEPGKGTGLGLAVSARLIDGMDGTITAHNTDGGARFTVLLPASDEPAEARAP
jgi:two-component system NtrC family sensor kinase